jgi:hypothetical protein
MPREITPATSLENLKKEAKRWLRALRAGDSEARARLDRAYPEAPREPVLRDVQHALARERGQQGWIALKQAIADNAHRVEDAADRPLLTLDEYDALAQDYVLAFGRDEAALARLNQHYQRTFTFDDVWAEIWRRDYAFRQRSSRVPNNSLPLDEARLILAQDTGYGSWKALQDAIRTGTPGVPAFSIDSKENRVGPLRNLTDAEWDRLIAVMKERRITALDAGGLMTDDVLARVATLPHVTALTLGGSRQLTDDGLRHLAEMPQLEHLDLSEYPGGRLTDRGLEALRHLPNLRRFEMTWQSGITDKGIENLRACDRLEVVNLMGSPTGDGAIRALAGKPNLRRFSSGKRVTDEGLPLLHAFPRLKTWHGPPPSAVGKKDDEVVGHLLIDGPFSSRGLASLAGLEGVADLDLFWHVDGLTSDAFASLPGMPNLLSLGADGKLSDDAAMRHISVIPRLRRLRAQESVATDKGFEALARSQTLEGFWGRVCPNFGNGAFRAFSTMPSLSAMGVGLENVEDDVLALFPRFPVLRELTPIGVRDAGFRHIGLCTRLERLTCMYCRESGDEATTHIAGLQIRYYYAGLTQITDRSLEVLGGMPSLEQVELYECKGVTDAGVRFLAALPHLREVALDGLPGVTFAGTQVFPAGVRVRYST